MMWGVGQGFGKGWGLVTVYDVNIGSNDVLKETICDLKQSCLLWSGSLNTNRSEILKTI